MIRDQFSFVSGVPGACSPTRLVQRALAVATDRLLKQTRFFLVSVSFSILFTVGTSFAQQGEVTAESLLAEAVALYEIGQQADGIVRRGAYAEALIALDRIVERFPASDLAVQILLGESVGNINVSDLRQAVASSESMPADVSVGETAVNRAPAKPSSPAAEDIATAVTRCYASDTVGETDDPSVVLRVRLDGTGRLTEPPSLLAPDRISAAERRLMRLASAALQECQPYSVVGESSQVAIVFRAGSVAVATEEILEAAQASDATTVKPIAAVAPREAAPAPATAEARSTPNVQEREDALGLDRNARRDIQRRLVLLGFDTRGVDGMFGPGTRGAIANWQRTRGHPNSGFFDRAQLQDLTAESEIAFQEWSRQQVRAQPQPTPQTGAGTRQAAPSGRYLDSRGCLREPDGRYVPNFRANCR